MWHVFSCNIVELNVKNFAYRYCSSCLHNHQSLATATFLHLSNCGLYRQSTSWVCMGYWCQYVSEQGVITTVCNKLSDDLCTMNTGIQKWDTLSLPLTYILLAVNQCQDTSTVVVTCTYRKFDHKMSHILIQSPSVDLVN